jgi:hypothetical protein
MFPKIGDGFWADAKISETLYLRLFATETGLGPGSAVFDMIAKRWLPNREWADTIEDAQKRAERLAYGYYRAVGTKDPFPTLEWKRTGDQ